MTLPSLSNFVFIVLVGSLSLTCRSNGITEKEKTLAIIKPDGLYGNYTENIKKAILDSGFTILKEMTIQLDEDAAMGFYAEHSSKGFFSSLVKYMTSGSVLIMVLEKENAVADWRALIGPTDARSKDYSSSQYQGNVWDDFRKKIVFTGQILFNQLNERLHLSLRRSLQVE